mmetsp:Transcript_44634/g.71801  ORF Transcript_44634/g.71801 Transcript_44634/m.71801 type:complete len:263 (-) Transcript_44634:191-979(-)
MHLAINQLGLASDRGFAGAIKCGKKGSLAINADLCVMVVERRDVLDGACIVGAHLDANSALGNGRKHVVPVKSLGYTVLHVHALQTGKRKERAVDNVVVELAQTGLHVATEVDTLDFRVLRENLRLASERCRTNDGALGHFFKSVVLGRYPRVARVLARQHGLEVSVVRKPGGHVLHGVHAKIHLVFEECHIELLGEETLAAYLRQRLAELHVARGVNYVDLHTLAVLAEILGEGSRETLAGLIRLRERKRRTPRAELDCLL